MATQMDKLLAAQEKALQKKHEAEQQEKLLKKQIADLKNKERTRRLCTRGAYLEKKLQEPEMLTDEDVFGLLDHAFSTPYVRDRLSLLLAGKHRGTSSTDPDAEGDQIMLGLT